MLQRMEDVYGGVKASDPDAKGVLQPKCQESDDQTQIRIQYLTLALASNETALSLAREFELVFRNSAIDGAFALIGGNEESRQFITRCWDSSEIRQIIERLGLKVK